MTVTLTWCTILDINNVPNADSLPDIQMEEVVRCKASRPCRPTKDNDFVGLHTSSTMGSSGRRRSSSGYIDYFLLYTFLQKRVVRSSVYVLSVMENCPVLPVAPPKRQTLLSAQRVMLCPKRGRGVLPKTSNFSKDIVFENTNKLLKLDVHKRFISTN